MWRPIIGTAALVAILIGLLAGPDIKTVISGIVAVGVAVGLYFVPSLLARHWHRRKTGAIFALNLLLGWSVLGWIIALVWALIPDEPAVPVRVVS